MGRRPEAEPAAEGFHTRRLKIADSYRLKLGADLAPYTSILAEQRLGETRHFWGFIGPHREFVIVGPHGEVASARSAMDAKLNRRRLEEREIASEIADSVRFFAGMFPVKCDRDEDGGMFTIKLPKDLEHLGILPKEKQDVMVIASGDVIEVWTPQVWIAYSSQQATRIPALLDPPRSSPSRESEESEE